MLSGKLVRASGGDPEFDNVVALIHFEGSDGDTTSVDRSQYGNTITSVNTTSSPMQLDDSITPVAGTCSLYNGPSTNGDKCWYITSTGTEFDVLDKEWTEEIWVRRTTASGNYVLGNGCFNFKYYQTQNPANLIAMYIRSNTGIAGPLYTSTVATWADNDWHHVACVRDNTTDPANETIYLYYDGVLVRTYASGGSFGTLYSPGVPYNRVIGAANDTGSFDVVQPHRSDSYRWTIGTCRYPGGITFDIPNVPFPTSKYKGFAPVGG